MSKNGNLLLDIGPRADGTIPGEVQSVLRAIGAWLQVNGEAIYGTRPWRVFGEGPMQPPAGAFHDADAKAYTAEDFRFTIKGDALYAIELAPGGEQVLIHSLAGGSVGSSRVRSVALLGSSAIVTFQQEKDGLHITVPLAAPAGPLGTYARCFRIQFE